LFPEFRSEFAPREQPEAGSLFSADEAMGIPIGEDTGWENVSSISKSPSLRARIEMQDDEVTPAGAGREVGRLGGAERPNTVRYEAKVTPFPGTVLHRHAEQSEADMQRGTTSADVLGDIAAQAREEQPEAGDAPGGNQDELADAVQSALRNIYGGYAEQA